MVFNTNNYLLLHDNKRVSVGDINHGLDEKVQQFMITIIDLRGEMLLDHVKQSGFMLSTHECMTLLSTLDTYPKREQKINLIKFCRSYPFTHKDLTRCKEELKIYSVINDRAMCTTHVNKRYLPVLSDTRFSSRETELLTLSRGKHLRYHSVMMRNVIYAAVLTYGSNERLYVGKAVNIKNRWGTSGTSHLAIVRRLVQDSDFLLCNPLLVDLCLTCFSARRMKLFIIDQLEGSGFDTLDELERYYITRYFKDSKGRTINLESSPYGMNMLANEEAF